MNFQIEDFQTFMMDAVPLWKLHQKEVGMEEYKDKRPFAPDIKKYLFYENNKQLIVFTVREGTILLGYAVFIISAPMHYRFTLYANNDSLYLHPTIRKGMTGYKFIKWCEEKIKELSKGNIQLITWRTKADHNFGVLLERQNYNKDDVIYSKWIGEING